MKAYLGIDPGKTGCACLIIPGKVHFMNWSDVDRASRIIEGWNAEHDLSTVIEKVHSMPTDGHVGAFRFGENFGMWQGVLAALRIKFDMVTPQAWHKTVGMLNPKRKGIDPKEWSIATARKLYPALERAIYLRKHHNLADALLIAHFSKMRNSKKISS